MRTFQTDENNDFVTDAAGNLVIFSGLEAEGQESRHFAAAARGEMIHQTQNGVPFFPLAFGGTPSPTQYAAAIRARLRQSPDVIEVLSVEARQVSDALIYTANIRTASGVTTING